jgi:hypothetical protein
MVHETTRKPTKKTMPFSSRHAKKSVAWREEFARRFSFVEIRAVRGCVGFPFQPQSKSKL